MPVITHDFQSDERALDLICCLYCGRTPSRVHGDHCAPRELKELGKIPLRYINPKGVERFDGRPCMTCGTNIMDHWILNGKDEFFCDRDGMRASAGMAE